MPVAKGPKFDVRSGLIISGLAVVAALIIGVVAVSLGQQSGRLILGDIDFRSLDTDNMAAEISENGPILWPDVGSGSRDIWLQHLGDDPATGWTAFDARPAGSARECNVIWSSDSGSFSSGCDEGLTYPADGTGLPPIAVYLNGRELIIDINNVRSADEFGGYSPE